MKLKVNPPFESNVFTEFLVMAHHNECTFKACERLHQPLHRAQIQVVRGLVEEQQPWRRLGQQCPRDFYAESLTARQFAALLGNIVIDEE